MNTSHITSAISAAITILALPVAGFSQTSPAQSSPATISATVRSATQTTVSMDNRKDATIKPTAALEKAASTDGTGVPHNGGNSAGMPGENNTITGLGQ